MIIKLEVDKELLVVMLLFPTVMKRGKNRLILWMNVSLVKVAKEQLVLLLLLPTVMKGEGTKLLSMALNDC